MTKLTYCVYSCNDCLANVAVDLTAHDVVRHIYRDDGGDYRLEPMMRHTDDVPAIQDFTSNGDLIFEIWFKNSSSCPWQKSQRLAFGTTVKEAEEAFLQKSFDRMMWNVSYWIVLSTEQFHALKEKQLGEKIRS